MAKYKPSGYIEVLNGKLEKISISEGKGKTPGIILPSDQVTLTAWKYLSVMLS